MPLLVTKREIKISTPGQDGEHQGAVAPCNESLPGGWTGVPGGLSSWCLDANSVENTHSSVQAGGRSLCFKSSLSLLFFF